MRSIVRLAALSVLLGWASAAVAIDINGDFDLLGQVRDDDQNRETAAPIDLYSRLGGSGFWGRSSFDTYSRLERTFGIDDGASDFYAGYAVVPGVIPGIELTGGRQFLSEQPGGVFVADGGKVRIDRGWPVSFSVYGGVPRYFEPLYGTKVLSRDEVLWGGTMQSREWHGGRAGLGYQQFERDDRTLRQLLTATATQSLSQLPGLPQLYGGFAYDCDGSSVDLGNAGVNFFLGGTRLLANIEGGYYQPQDHGESTITTDPDRREDPIFEAFSVSQLVQARGGLTARISREVSLRGDYSYQNYDATDGNDDHGNVGRVGLRWLPGGDGLETVGIDYYVVDSSGGVVNGGSLSYQNQVYERILFHTRFGIGYYDLRSNQDDIPVSSFVGLAYAIRPDLSLELNFEANHNERFDHDIRGGFLLQYNFRHHLDRPATGGA